MERRRGNWRYRLSITNRILKFDNSDLIDTYILICKYNIY